MANHTPPGQHTVKAFDTEFTEMRGLIGELGGRAEQALEQSILALRHGDEDLASRIVDADEQLDALERRIDRMVIRTMALRAPMADDLRDLVATLKIAHMIERVGDYAKNIAKRVPLIGAYDRIGAARQITPMTGATLEMVGDALSSFATRNADLANSVCRRDKIVDDFYNNIFHDLTGQMEREPALISDCVHLIFIAKNLERVGDHATNIAETVYFAVTGDDTEERERGLSPLTSETGTEGRQA